MKNSRKTKILTKIEEYIEKIRTSPYIRNKEGLSSIEKKTKELFLKFMITSLYKSTP